MKNIDPEISDEELKIFEKINVNISKERYEKVIELSEKAKQKFPGQIFFYITHSIANSQMGNSTEALRILTDAEKIFPGDYEIYYQIAKVYEDMKLYDEAEKYFLKSSDSTPEDNYEARSECLNDIGVLKYAQGKIEEANEYWAKALEEDPDNGNAKLNLYNLEDDEDDEDDEESYFDDLEDDFYLFQKIQEKKYLRSQNKKKFKSKDEKAKVKQHILAEWTGKIVPQMDKMITSDIKEKTKWYESIEIDFSGEPPEIDMPVINHPMYNEMAKVFSFLPPNGVSYLMLAFPFLQATGITEEDFEEMMIQGEISDEEKSKCIWAVKIGERFFKISDSKSEEDFIKRADEIISIASQWLSRKKADKILRKMIEEMTGG